MQDSNTVALNQFLRAQEKAHRSRQMRLDDEIDTVFMEVLNGDFDSDIADYVDRCDLVKLALDLAYHRQPISAHALRDFRAGVESFCESMADRRID